jgi:hypothetical protein
MTQDNGFILSVDNLAFALLAVAGFGLYAITLFLCWVLLIFPKTRNTGRNVLGKLVSRGWFLMLPSISCMIEVRLRDPESMEPVVVAFYMSGLAASAWLTRHFFKSAPLSHESITHGPAS